MMTRLISLRRTIWIASVCTALGCAGGGADPAFGDSSETTSGSGSSGSGGATGSSSGSGASTAGSCDTTLPWTGDDNRAASSAPPNGLAQAEVPMFVTIGWDDNGYPDSMQWALDFMSGRSNPGGSNPCTYDGAPATHTFFNTTTYISQQGGTDPVALKKAWNEAWSQGHEIGNHTHLHEHGSGFTSQQWETAIGTCMDWLTKPFDPNQNTSNDTSGAGIPIEEIWGFRTPFLEYNNALFPVLQSRDFWYDCSIEDGWHWDQDGTNFTWPYTLDQGSEGHELLVGWGTKDESLSPAPGLWQMPVHPVIVPPDDACPQYGCQAGLRAKMKALHDWFDEDGGKVTGFDYNLWDLFKLTKAEVVATLKYTLDQRLKGNRAPFLFGAHTDYYSPSYGDGTQNSTFQERREAIEEFLEYAFSKQEARVVSYKQVLDWVRSPSAM